MKEVVGKVTGNSKLEAKGKTDQLKGKVQNAVGGVWAARKLPNYPFVFFAKIAFQLSL